MSDDLVSRLKSCAKDCTMLGDEVDAAFFNEAAQALSEARAEIEEWRQAASVEAGLRREFFTRAEKAESELSTLRSCVREVVGPFARADRAIGSEPGPFRFETGTGHRLIERGDLAAASRFMEELK